MEVHGTQPTARRKEIRCRDCGHVYAVAHDAQSSSCAACGNVAFHGPETGEVSFAGFSFAAAALGRVMPKVRPAKSVRATVPNGEGVTGARDPLAAFTAVPDGRAVADILFTYQVEWQLWAVLVKRFGEPAVHSAYLAQAARDRTLGRAAERYREHRSVMALLPDTNWQAAVADLMLARVETLSLVQLAHSGGDGFRAPEWMRSLPLGRGVFRVGWITLGLVGTARIFGLI